MAQFWEIKGWEKTDKHLLAVKKMPFVRSTLNIELKEGLQIIRGPRQVGKSSLLKMILSQSVGQGLDTHFETCELLEDYKELYELLRSISHKKVILLDEICFVRDWPRAVKKFIDEGFSGSLILTGSNSFDLKKGFDLMPGRWAKGESEHYLLPMLYDEWRQMRKQAGWPELNWTTGLEKFFTTGGFPAAVAEAGPNCKKPLDSMNTYKRWLLGDFLKAGKQETYIKELMEQLAITLCSTISLQKLSQKTQIMSHHTAQDYIELLESCFALRTLYAVDNDTGKFRYKKEKKFYFTDPLIYWIAMDWANLSAKSTSNEKLAEMVAHEQLARTETKFGYFSSPKGEIDFLKPEHWAIEVKWAPVVKNLSQAYKDLVIPNKKVWSQTTILL